MDPIKHFSNSFNVDVIGSEIKAYLGPDKWNSLHIYLHLCVSNKLRIYLFDDLVRK